MDYATTYLFPFIWSTIAYFVVFLAHLNATIGLDGYEVVTLRFACHRSIQRIVHMMPWVFTVDAKFSV